MIVDLDLLNMLKVRPTPHLSIASSSADPSWLRAGGTSASSCGRCSETDTSAWLRLLAMLPHGLRRGILSRGGEQGWEVW